MPVKELAPLPNPPSPKHLSFNRPPGSPSALPNPRKKTYSDMYLAKKASSQKPLAAIQPTPSVGGHWGNTGSLSSGNDRGAPLFTPRHSSVSDDHSTASIMQPNSSMSVTWPHSGSMALSKVTNQITADTSKLTGGNNNNYYDIIAFLSSFERP